MIRRDRQNRAHAIVWVQTGKSTIVPISITGQPKTSAPIGRTTNEPIQMPIAQGEVQPEPAFRQNLHRALEASHRQQAAQRALGTHASVDWREDERTQDAQSRAWSSALFLMALSLIWLALGKRLTKKRSA
jgi:hypothetical protein